MDGHSRQAAYDGREHGVPGSVPAKRFHAARSGHNDVVPVSFGSIGRAATRYVRYGMRGEIVCVTRDGNNGKMNYTSCQRTLFDPVTAGFVLYFAGRAAFLFHGIITIGKLVIQRVKREFQAVGCSELVENSK